MNHPGKFWVWALVDPEFQGRGVARRLSGWLARELSRLGARTVWANARDDRPGDLRFLESRGFREIWRNVCQRLNVEETDLSRIDDAMEHARGQGIAIVTLAEESARNPDYLRDLCDLHNLVEADVPRAGYFTPAPYQEFADDFAREGVLPDAYFLAKDGDRWVGVSYLTKMDGDPHTLEVGLTGVRREYRRRGIATALKLRTIGFARNHGYHAIETGNDSTNQPILALNRSVGFKRTYAWVSYEKDFSSEGGQAG